MIDIAAIKRDRGQLWAEAAALEAADARDELIRLDRSLWSAASAAQKERMVENADREALEAALGTRTGRISSEDVYRLLGIAVERRHQTLTEMVGEAMRDLGWEKKKVKFEGTSLMGYLKGSDAQRMIELALVKDDLTGRLQLAPEDLTSSMFGSLTREASASTTM